MYTRFVILVLKTLIPLLYDLLYEHTIAVSLSEFFGSLVLELMTPHQKDEVLIIPSVARPD